MPRPFLKDRHHECRLRKVKCDGHRPVCLRCERGSRDCRWSSSYTQPSPSGSQPPLPGTPSTPLGLTAPYRNSGYTSSRDPEKALQDPDVARIFRYYVDHLAGWYDLNDSRRHFGDIVPICARQNSLLLSAILAFSAASQGSSSSSRRYKDLAESYHLESVQELLSLTSDEERFRTGETLAAICLLRSYEIISQNVTAQSHLHGSYSLLSSLSTNIGTGLLSAGFWNYLREDITVALIDKRSLKIDLSDRHIPPRMEGDDDLANYISYLLGKIINQCLDEQTEPVSEDVWECLKGELDSWKDSLRGSFDPIETPRLYGESSFPCLWTTCGWHASSLQYYHTAMCILCLAQPSHILNTLQHINRIKELEIKLSHHATQVCALAISSNSAPVWVNSFGPISFCGPWLRDRQKISELTTFLEKWGRKTGWPVASTIDSLSRISSDVP
ncbi:hypothetical protein ASPWEDRAFT_60968 [Aspergillus wentii DTO 134E9]|uniref:Zn(2)-C6 fungal-type domain-containing protein n=1 Tax=Aspergillus wentii DTO 134E9 TaxID=1073089 RepID=A0A1L9RCJ1_ASPWE|nr:uncharacterized protein ASPWEDRAFT_60968 [Aspergillus wentii DTO 134E9]OJJ32640.1 hypothetical protein ASPWEDRAFT_60968 [Aspergillus wentii DTO 134E9]